MPRRTHATRCPSQLTRSLAAVTLASLTALASPASAQPAPESQPASGDTEAMKEARRKLFTDALRDMADKQWEACRVKTLGAWAARKHPQVASLLGICEVELGLFREAAEHLHYALENGEGEEPIRGPQVKEAFAKAQAKVGTVAFTATQAEVELRVGGEVVARAPATLFFAPGEHTVEATLQGYAAKSEKLSVAAGDSKAVAIQLEALGAGAGDPERPDPTDEPVAKRPLWPAIVLGGVAAAGVGLGITGFVVAGGARSDADDAAAAGIAAGGCGPDGSRCPSGLDALDQVNTMRGVGVAGFAVGGAALAGMIVYLVLPDPAPTERSMWLAPTFGNANGLSLGGTF